MARYTEKEVPDLGVYPATTYGLHVDSATHSHPGEPLKIEVKFTMTGPASFVGRKYTERFMLGTEDDPDADRGDTKRNGFTGINWGRYHALAKVAGVFCGDTEEEVAALNATHPDVVADMTKRTYVDKNTKEVKGPFNNLARFYAPGKKEPKEPPEEPMDPSSSASSGSSATGGASSAASRPCPDCNGKMIPERLWTQHSLRHASPLSDEQ